MMSSGRVRPDTDEQMALVVECEVDGIPPAGRMVRTVAARPPTAARFTRSIRALPGCKKPRRLSHASVIASALEKGALSACDAADRSCFHRVRPS